MSENCKIQKYENTIVNLKFGATQNRYFFIFALNKYKYFLCSTHIYAISSFVLITFTSMYSIKCFKHSIFYPVYACRITKHRKKIQTNREGTSLLR